MAKELTDLSSLDIDDDLLGLFLLISFKTHRLFPSDILNIVFQNDLFKFLDVFAGTTIRVPTRSRILKMMLEAKIFLEYLKDKDNPEVLKVLANRYNKRERTIREIVNRIEKIIKEVKQT